MRRPVPGARRPGLTLLEVLLSLAIFLFSLVGIARLMNMATDRARDVQWQSRAIRLAQSKLNEVIAGVIPINGGGSGNFDDEGEPDWQWSIDSEANSTAQNLYVVSVHVWRETQDLGKVETTLAQYVFDPTQRGGVTQAMQAAQQSQQGQAGGQSGQQQPGANPQSPQPGPSTSSGSFSTITSGLGAPKGSAPTGGGGAPGGGGSKSGGGPGSPSGGAKGGGGPTK